MGKINDMKNINLSYMINKSKQRKVTKPRLRVKTARDLAILIGPNGGKYRLSPSQRNVQLKGRLTIAAIAAAVTIGGGVAYNSTSTKTQNPTAQEIANMQELSKKDVTAQAEEKLLTFLYKNALFLKEQASVKYDHDDKINCDTISVYRQLESPNADPILEFSYTRYNNWNDRLMYPSKNSPEVTQLLDSMIDVHFAENISQEDIENLDTKISNFDMSKFELKENSIVGISERNLGEER